jgi:hypothetical protein
MSSEVLANLYVSEATLTGSPSTITFPWRARRVIVTNDSTLNSLSVTISGQTLTLKPTETLTANIHVSSLIVNGTLPYRVWAFG